MLAFMTGELSRADGVGIIFSDGLPRSSDIQKIISVCLGQLSFGAFGPRFLNRTGRVCIRINQRVMRIGCALPQIEIGDILEALRKFRHFERVFRW